MRLMKRQMYGLIVACAVMAGCGGSSTPVNPVQNLSSSLLAGTWRAVGNRSKATGQVTDCTIVGCLPDVSFAPSTETEGTFTVGSLGQFPYRISGQGFFIGAGADPARYEVYQLDATTLEYYVEGDYSRIYRRL